MHGSADVVSDRNEITTVPAAAKKLAEDLPSLNSKDFGKPFAETFAAVKGDFYAIDPMLFSPAKVTVTALETGESFQAGHIDTAVLARSFR